MFASKPQHKDDTWNGQPHVMRADRAAKQFFIDARLCLDKGWEIQELVTSEQPATGIYRQQNKTKTCSEGMFFLVKPFPLHWASFWYRFGYCSGRNTLKEYILSFRWSTIPSKLHRLIRISLIRISPKSVQKVVAVKQILMEVVKAVETSRNELEHVLLKKGFDQVTWPPSFPGVIFNKWLSWGYRLSLGLSF